MIAFTPSLNFEYVARSISARLDYMIFDGEYDGQRKRKPLFSFGSSIFDRWEDLAEPLFLISSHAEEVFWEVSS